MAVPKTVGEFRNALSSMADDVPLRMALLDAPDGLSVSLEFFGKDEDGKHLLMMLSAVCPLPDESDDLEVCDICNGSGKRRGRVCDECEGTGKC